MHEHTCTHIQRYAYMHITVKLAFVDQRMRANVFALPVRLYPASNSHTSLSRMDVDQLTGRCSGSASDDLCRVGWFGSNHAPEHAIGAKRERHYSVHTLWHSSTCMHTLLHSTKTGLTSHKRCAWRIPSQHTPSHNTSSTDSVIDPGPDAVTHRQTHWLTPQHNRQVLSSAWARCLP